MHHEKNSIGIEFFDEFSKEDYYYVDKTMFIADLLHNRGKVSLLTRPRQLVILLNMSMFTRFHGMLLGLFQYEGDWDTISNAESGEGYSDILIRTEQGIGSMIETKYAEDGDLEKGCEEALEQIRDKKNDSVLREDGVKEILEYGLAFYKKNCRVVLG